MKVLYGTPIFLRVSAILLTFACQLNEGASGTAVGNPIGMEATIAPAEGAVLSRALAPTDQLLLQGCDGTSDSLAVGASLELLQGEALRLPGGDWCSLRLVFTGPLDIGGIVGEDSLFVASLVVGSVDFVSEAGMGEGASYLMELGKPGWIDGGTLDLVAGASTEIPNDSADYLAMVSAIQQDSAIYRDGDDNGALSEEERGLSPEALGGGIDTTDTGEADEQEAEEDDEKTNPGKHLALGHDTGDHPGRGHAWGRSKDDTGD